MPANPPPRPAPTKARMPPLDPAAAACDGLARIVDACLAQFEVNRSGLLAGRYHPEYVHQMRVALRRLRSALGLFGGVEPALKAPPLLAEIRALAAALGRARDLDVFVDTTLPKVLAAAAPGTALAALAAHAGTVRRRRRLEARAVCAQPRVVALAAQLREWLAALCAGLAADHVLRRPLAAVAPALLGRRYRGVRRRGRRLARRSAAERHLLRIAVKKLRYATDFLGGLYADAASRPAFAAALAELQDLLGTLNDLAVTAHVLVELDAGEEPGATHAAAGAQVRDCVAAHADAHLRELAEAWRGFKATPRFWTGA